MNKTGGVHISVTCVLHNRDGFQSGGKNSHFWRFKSKQRYLQVFIHLFLLEMTREEYTCAPKGIKARKTFENWINYWNFPRIHFFNTFFQHILMIWDRRHLLKTCLGNGIWEWRRKYVLSEYIIILVSVIMIPCVRSNNRGVHLKLCGLKKGNIIEYQISKVKYEIFLKSYLLIAGLVVRESPIKIECKSFYSMRNFSHSFRQYMIAYVCIIKSIPENEIIYFKVHFMNH